ncbi:DMT family transporter [Rheinheimera aquimaris]|uniref:DMT family transporter n=1 Tax=Rheinheimera aquimaris TaxID=412437 RepID=UPI003A97B2FF
MKHQTPIVTVSLLVLSIFSWGSVFPVSKLVLGQMTENSLVVWRFTIAALCLMICLLVKRQRWPQLSIRQYAWVLLISLIGVGGFNLLLFTGVKQTAATNGALVMALSPLVTALTVAALSRKWLNRTQTLSLAIGLSGVLLVITKGSWQALAQFQFNQGDLTIIAAMLLWSAYTTASQKVAGWLPLLPFTLVSMLAGDAFILAFNATQGDIHPVTELLSLPLQGIMAVIYIGVFGTVVGYVFFLNAVQRLGSAPAALFFNLIPVCAALTAVMMGQEVTSIQVTGMAVVLLGLMLPQLLKLVRQRNTIQTCDVNS